MPMEVYRIQKDKHRDTILTGEGARLFGGRWNKEGTPLVYTSTSMELALLEATVHFEGLPPAGLPPYILVTMELPDEVVYYPAIDQLPTDWQLYEGYPSDALNAFVQRQFKQTGCLGVAVPSVVMPHSKARNILLNPLNLAISQVRITAIRPHEIDPRLL
jgi:RES domain-containing protein